MLNIHSRFSTNSEEVVAKVIDGDAIIINLKTGIYYSMDNTGGLIWKLMEEGRSLEEIGKVIAANYEVSGEKALEDVKKLAAELLQEELVSLSEEKPSDLNTIDPVSEKIQPYESPVLNIYRDMGDLLALDPPMPGLAPPPWQNTAVE